MRDTTSVGSLSEAKILARLLELGWEVLVPWRRMRRYDLVIERDGHFYKVQCKTGRLSSEDGAIHFNTSNTNGTSRQQRNYVGQINYFAVYCPDNQKVYLVPMSEDLGVHGCRLRVAPSKNNQTKGIRLAADYEL